MADREALTRWQKEHTYTISLRLNRRTDADIIAYLEWRQERQKESSKQAVIKDIFKEMMADDGFRYEWEAIPTDAGISMDDAARYVRTAIDESARTGMFAYRVPEDYDMSEGAYITQLVTIVRSAISHDKGIKEDGTLSLGHAIYEAMDDMPKSHDYPAPMDRLLSARTDERFFRTLYDVLKVIAEKHVPISYARILYEAYRWRDEMERNGVMIRWAADYLSHHKGEDA